MQKGHTPSNDKRIKYLDILRGIMLVIMTFDHLGGPIKTITFQPLGFVSAAAGFIYLSGFVYGVVYTRKYLETDFSSIRNKSGKRAGVIYIYHLLVLFIVIVPYFMGFYDAEELATFRDGPVRSTLFFALLLFQPSNMDILPMYIIFILAGPYALKAIVAGKWKAVFTISVLLWLINQLPVFQYTRYDGGGQLIDLGYFNIFCWQILFFSGVLFGYAKVSGKFRLPVSKWTIALAIFCSFVLLLARHMPSGSDIYILFEHFADRSSLGPVRLGNFTLLAYMIYAYTKAHPDSVRSGWLSLLGRHSLQVFAYSVCLIYFLQPAKFLAKQTHPWVIILVDLILVSTLLLPALLHQGANKRFPAFRSAGL